MCLALVLNAAALDHCMLFLQPFSTFNASAQLQQKKEIKSIVFVLAVRIYAIKQKFSDTNYHKNRDAKTI